MAPRRLRASALVVLVTLVLLTQVSTSVADASNSPPATTYVPPVDAPVVDGFRPPSTPYGQGHRGLEYATRPGTAVRASGGGDVTFAGFVAGDRFVTVLHPDGLRTTYSYLSTIAIRLGDHVEQGDRVGTTGDRLLFTARIGDAYVDPAVLLGAGPLEVHLVPDEGLSPLAQRGAIAPTGLLAQAVDWARTRRATAVPSFGRTLAGALPPSHLLRLVGAALEWRRRSSDCTPETVPAPAPAAGHVAVLVGGLGSSSDAAAVDDLDTAALGYAPADVVRFSYAGGAVPDPTDRSLGAVPVRAYAPQDTEGDLVTAGDRLADMLESLAASFPAGRAPPDVDVIAHSQGGLVARLALAALERRGSEISRRVLATLGTVVTLGAPHQGAELAGAVALVRALPAGDAVLDSVAAVAHLGKLDVDPASAAVAELAIDSPLVRTLAATPLPAAVRFVSIAARGDVVVPAGRSRLAGAVDVIVDGGGPFAHERLPASAEAAREVALALAGLPPTCETLFDALGDTLVSDGIAAFEAGAGLLVAAGVAITTG